MSSPEDEQRQEISRKKGAQRAADIDQGAHVLAIVVDVQREHDTDERGQVKDVSERQRQGVDAHRHHLETEQNGVERGVAACRRELHRPEHGSQQQDDRAQPATNERHQQCRHEENVYAGNSVVHGIVVVLSADHQLAKFPGDEHQRDTRAETEQRIEAEQGFQRVGPVTLHNQFRGEQERTDKREQTHQACGVSASRQGGRTA
ncbi:MAG: hypothetical protein M5U09_16180 [Gammaproteobacteria bacterium]|nr:hypothetical protein [Gammaproteobacteria bacterium]